MARPDSSPDEIAARQRHFASKCPKFGEPKPQIPNFETVKMEVLLGMPQVGSGEGYAPELVSSCKACVHYLNEDKVANEWGWSVPICAAKGTLLLGNRLTVESKDCEYKSFAGISLGNGTPNGDGFSTGWYKSLQFLPEYAPGFTGSVATAFVQVQQELIEPSTYETDAPVSADDAASGIRAWRKIVSQEDEVFSVMIPVYERSFFTPLEQRKIPNTGDSEHPEHYVDHFDGVYTASFCWQVTDQTPAFWGQPGTGKTEFLRHMAWLMQIPYERFSITASSELEDLAGKIMVNPTDGTYFQYGRFVKAWQRPCVLVVDEPNTGQNDVWQFFRPLTDDSKQLILDMNDGETLDRTDGTFLAFCMNPAWDVKNVGANPISDADVNRLMHNEIPLPDESVEMEIIKQACEDGGFELRQDQLETIMAIGTEIRGLCDNGTLPITWAIRPQIKVARALQGFKPLKAYSLAVADFLEPSVREQILDVVNAHVSEG